MAIVATQPVFQKTDLLFPLGFFLGNKAMPFFKSMAFWGLLLDMLVAKREPTPCYHDAYSVGIPKGACGGKSGQRFTVRPQFPPCQMCFSG